MTPLLASLLCADWKIVTRTGNSSLTEFLKGALIRTDSPAGYSTVADFDHRRQITWRRDLQQYAIFYWPAEHRDGSPPGPVILIERHTIDTGERKQSFGRTARHLLTRVTRNDGPETTIDGWYIDVQGIPRWKSNAGGSLALLSISPKGQGPPQIKVKDTGPTPEGLPVWRKVTSAGHESISEVTDVTEATLADKLFQPPDGYQRVATLPVTASRPVPRTWVEQLQAQWLNIENWLSAML